MSTELTSDRTGIVARLRAAGCVFAEQEAELLLAGAGTRADLAAMVARRVAGWPLEHVLGRVRFCGLDLTLTPGVFVPRPRSGLLVRTAIALLSGRAATVVDLCCGCGAIGAAVADGAPAPVRLHAADVDPAAVACARRNLARYRGRVHLGDMFAALPSDLRGDVDVLVANVPYVPTGELGLLPREARQHEPRLALDGGADGLDVLRRLVTGASQWLSPHGRLLVETSQRQAPEAASIVRQAGLTSEVVRDDELDATVVVGHAASWTDDPTGEPGRSSRQPVA